MDYTTVLSFVAIFVGRISMRILPHGRNADALPLNCSPESQ